MKNHSIHSVTHSKGSALLIVLAFLLLLTTLTVAFLSRATFERLLSNASFSQGKVDLAGQGAITAIIGDLQQEIVAGSTGSTTTPTLASGYYYPNSSATAVPAVVGFTPAAGVENLLKISQGGISFWPSTGYNSAGPQRASSVSTVTASLNGRSVTNVRWNKPLLMQPINIVSGASTTDYTPPTAFTSNPPEWIYVARDGSNPQGTTLDTSYIYSPNVSPAVTPTLGTFGTDPVTQRYAYAIYDEGSTLDLNSAGCPVTGTSGSAVTYSSNQSYKNALAYADLTQLPGIGTANGSLTALSAAYQEAFVNAIVGWRNSATAKLTNPSSTPIFPNGYPSSFPTGPFDANVIFNTSGFLTVGGTALTKSDNFKGTANQSDNAFTSRQLLLQFFLQGLGQNTTFSGNVPLGNLVGVLPYLGTFSRDINQPSYASPVSFANSTAPTLSNNTGTGGNNVSTASGYASSVDALINPAFLAVTVGSNSGTSGWTRNNGTTAIAGEPLVKKRFALMRLAWLTYAGPSANRNGVKSGTTASSTADGADYDIYLMENTYGIPASFLAQGTAQNIYNYFGLTWVTDPNNSGSSEWAYSHSGAFATSSSTPSITSASSLTKATILTLPSVAGLSSTLAREPDFFELLKAGLCVGSIGKAYGAYNSKDNPPTPADYYAQRDQDVDNTIIQIGANIISQYQPSGYPARILYDDGLFGAAYQEHRGVVDLPYIYQVQESKMRLSGQDSSPAYNSCPAAGSASSNGQCVDLQVPVIWNPHAWTSTSGNSDGNPRPTNFRIYAETCSPFFDATGTNPDPTMTFYAYTNFRAANLTVYPSTDSVAAPKPASLTLTNTEMDFSIPQSDNYLFREPTLLNKPGIPTGSNLAIGSGHTIKNAPFSGNYITSLDAAYYYSKVTVSPADNKQYIGVVLGGTTLPLAWTEPGSGPPASSAAIGALDGTNPTTANSPCAVPAEFAFVSNTNAYITYRLQYQDANSNWITYDEKYAPIVTASTYNSWKNSNGGWEWTFSSVNSEIITDEGIAVCFDPRTGRWGLIHAGRNGGRPISSPALNWMGTGPASNPGWAAPVTGATTANVTYAAEENAIWSARPDEYQGFIFSTGTNWGNFWGPSTGPLAAGWYSAPTDVGSVNAVIRPGLACQNNMAVYSASANYSPRYAGDASGIVSTFGLGCYTDPDGVVRRGMAAYVPPTSLIPASTSASGAGAASGIPLKVAYTFPTANSATLTANAELASRPIMINRPFRSVADIGHVFSDTPWRNLDFSTPESGNPGFLDIFCINDTNDPNGLVAGKVNLNTRQASVLQAILGGAYKDEFGTVPVLPGTSGTASVATASVIATGLVSRTTGGTYLVNIGDLVGKWSPPSSSPNGVTNSNATSPNNIDGSQSYAGFSGTSATTSAPSSSPQNLSYLLTQDTTATGYNTNNVNRMREVAIRALANSGTTRVWNLMIDVVAQTGRFPSSASSLANFNVEGERRYWVHVAIDRYTGKVLDEQVEEVKE